MACAAFAGTPTSTPGAQWSNAAAVDGATCLAALKASGAKFTAHAPQASPDKKGCGMPQAVTLSKGPTGIVYAPALTIDCSMALELVAAEPLVQEEARASLGSELKKIETLGSYVCRNSSGPLTTQYAGKKVLSEHAFGLAVDLKAFVPKKGKPIRVANDWGKDDARGAFLRDVRRRMLKETKITHVITPDYNAAHHDHLHVDRGLPWGWWWNTSP